MTVYTFTFDPPVAYVDRYGSDCFMSEFKFDLYWISPADDDRAMLEIVERIASGQCSVAKTITTERTEPLTPWRRPALKPERPPSERKRRKNR